MTTIALTALLIVANVTGAGMAFPQAARLVRTRNTDGVSAVWAGVSVSMNIWWLTYGIANNLWGLVPVSAVGVALYLVIAVTFVRAAGARTLRQLAAGALVLGMGPMPFLVWGGWQAAGLAIGLFYGLQLAPAVIAACRTRVLDGVAPVTWVMAWIESVVWLVYGSFVVDVALLAGGVTGTLMSSIILVRLAVTGHQPLRIRRPAVAAL